MNTKYTIILKVGNKNQNYKTFKKKRHNKTDAKFKLFWDKIFEMNAN